MTWVLVETISQFRIRYMVEVPDENKQDWALDTVSMEKAKEFSQEFLGETILSHRVVSEQEALDLFRKDNDYVNTGDNPWDDETIKDAGFTFEKDLQS